MIEKCRNSKSFAIIITLIIYSLAFVACYFIYKVLPIENILLKFFIVDIIATVIVFIGSMICNNSSIYDPYWSVAPMVMVPLFVLEAEEINPDIDVFNIYTIVMILIVEIWGIRLTLNCLVRWKNLNHQDWRYVKFQEMHPRLWPLISLTGIHLMPTLVVFVAMLPIFSYINAFNNGAVLNGTWFICIIVSLVAILIETIADKQMDIFRKNPDNKGEICRIGLWKNSRHPNYFGEIIFWFGMFLFAISVQDAMWILIFSPLIIFLLFVIVSIPMMEKRQIKNKPEYAQYKKETNMLLPIWPPLKEEKK